MGFSAYTLKSVLSLLNGSLQMGCRVLEQGVVLKFLWREVALCLFVFWAALNI